MEFQILRSVHYIPRYEVFDGIYISFPGGIRIDFLILGMMSCHKYETQRKDSGSSGDEALKTAYRK